MSAGRGDLRLLCLVYAGGVNPTGCPDANLLNYIPETRLLSAAIGFLTLLIFSGCGDLSEVVVNANPAGGAVLVTDIAVLKEYSIACAAEWRRPPAFPFGQIPDGTATWTEQPPQGVFIPNGTKANIQNRQFLQDGKLVEPYAANSYDMQKNRAIEVESVKIKDGPHRELQGWLPKRFLYPTVMMP